VKAFPFAASVRDFIEKHDQVFVVEQNRDAQLRSLLMLDLEIDPARMISMLHYNGMPINAGFIVNKVLAEMAKGRAA
jgi:2-oxoglutarate ferredoxin oxidoreductase subunit alpha